MWTSNEHYISYIGARLDSNFTYVNNFYPLEVVDRGSDTQLEVGKIKLIYLPRLFQYFYKPHFLSYYVSLISYTHLYET